jgi:hypothetical protein
MLGRTKCYKHGGATPRGAAHPRYQGSRYSASLPANLATRYVALRDDPKILELRSEIAVLDLRLEQLTEQLSQPPADDAELPEQAERRLWRELRSCLQDRRRLVESERGRIVEAHAMLSAEQALGLLGAVVAIIRDEVPDQAILRRVSQRVEALAYLPSQNRPGVPGRRPKAQS